MKKELFVVADVHGYSNVLEIFLNEAGYDPSDSEYLLIDLGDRFDRGPDSKKIYEFYKELTDSGKAICLKGNHEFFMIDFLEGKDCFFNFIHNGFSKTIDSFLDMPDSYTLFCLYCAEYKNKDIARSLYGKRVEPLLDDFNSVPSEVRFQIYQDWARTTILIRYPELLTWLKECPDYYETKNYIFTHASIDGTCDDWHIPPKSPYEYWTDWQYLMWDNGSFFGSELKNTNKTVVVGHYHCDRIREKYNLEGIDGTNSILVRSDKKIIMIDACTPMTKRVNVLTIKDELL